MESDSAKATPGQCYCYILECSDGSYYTGWTTDPVRRTQAHNAGRGARYTRSRRPVNLVFVEYEQTRSMALRRERAIKDLPRSGKRRLIEASGVRANPVQRS